MTLRVVAALLGQGAQLLLGHDWRDNGVMEAVHAYVQRYRESSEKGAVVVRNYLAWPDRTRLKQVDRANISGCMEIIEFPEPAGGEGPARHRALTASRTQMIQDSDATVCVGGRTTGYQGMMPGTLEEALLTVRQSRALY